MRIKPLLFIVIVLFLESAARGDGFQNRIPEPGSGQSFLYAAKRFGVPIFKAAIKIENRFVEDGKLFLEVRAKVDSHASWGLFFRMNNRFTSIIERETFTPVRYVKEIDQEGLLIKTKNYVQTLTFNSLHRKVAVEKKGEYGKEEILLPAETYDPLSMFARYYLKDEFHLGEDIRISLYDGMRLRQMIFHSRKEKVTSKMYGEVEAVCLESTTSFAAFGDKEGIIRIWYTNNREKIPISMELDLPVGDVRFELEEVRKD